MKQVKYKHLAQLVAAVFIIASAPTGPTLAQDDGEGSPSTTVSEGESDTAEYEEVLREEYGDIDGVDELVADLDTPEDEQEPAPTAVAVQPDPALPPHPATPERLAEGSPTAETLASTEYVWIPGNWVWTGEAFEWVDGVWAYDLEGYHYVESDWVWQDDTWVFTAAGWAAAGSDLVQYGIVPVPEEGEEPVTTYQVEPATTTVYVHTTVYVAPLVVYPIWYPHYHAYWYVHYRPVPYYHPYRRAAVRRTAYRHHYYRHHNYRYGNSHYRGGSTRHHSGRARTARPSTSPARSTRGSSGARTSQPRSSQQRSRQRTSRQRSSGSQYRSRGGSVSRGGGRGYGGGGRGGGGRRR